MSASAATFDPRDLRPPRERGTTRAMLLAIAMHALLVAGLWVGVAWRTEEPMTVQAELWSSIPQTAAPAPRPAPQPEPVPQPPRPTPVPRVEEAPPVKAPDIALERKKEDERRKADALKREQERQKIEEDKKLKAEQERQKLVDDKKLKAEQKQKELDKKKEQARFDNTVKQLAAMASDTAPAGAPSNGTAAQTSGRKGDPSYAARVAQRIRGNTVFAIPPDLSGNPQVLFRVNLDPAGYILDVHKLTGSGLAGFDDAVERAIRKSEPFPSDASGRPPHTLDIQQRPKDN